MKYFPEFCDTSQNNLKQKEKVGRDQNTEQAAQSTGQQPVFATDTRKGTGFEAAL